MADRIHEVAVFCGSRFGNLAAYKHAAEAMGRGLAEAGMHVVYGGGDVGLMGVVADAAISAGGEVTGVIPGFLEAREIMHRGVTELIVTESMHERKLKMFSRADAYVILPGGFGTFDEMMEILTWKQLGLHRKPILIVNVASWADAVIALLDTAVEQGFASPQARSFIDIVPDVATALNRLSGATHEPTSIHAEERI